MQRFHAARLSAAHDGDAIVRHARLDFAWQPPAQFAFWTLDCHGAIISDADLDLVGNLDRFVSNPRHNFGTRLPDVSQQLASHVLLFRLAPRKDAARSGKNRDPHAAKNSGNLSRADIAAKPGPAHPLQ